MLREVKCPQRKMRMLALRITGTGTAAINEGASNGSANGATLTDNGTGDYTITFGTAFGRAPVCTVTPVATAGDVIATIHTVSTSAVRITTWDGTDGTTAKDAVFHLLVVGADAVDEN